MTEPNDPTDAAKKKKKLDMGSAWREAKDLIWARRGRLALGLGLMVISRLAGLVLPATPKFLIDEVIGEGRAELLPVLAFALGAATLVQGVTSFLVSQVLGVAAQASITEMRRRVQEHVARLPTSFFDSTKSGVLISRIMTDAEGIRNLVGTGLVQLTGGLLTAALAFFVLLYLNWKLTLVTLGVLTVFGAVMAVAFQKLRPIFRERNEINAQVTGRLAESLGGIRIVKVYTAEKREELIFTRGVHRLLRNIAKTITGINVVSALTTVLFGGVSIVMLLVGGRAILAGEMTLGDFMTYIFFTGLLVTPIIQVASIGTQLSEAFAGLDRIRELLARRTEDEHDASRAAVPSLSGRVEFEDVYFAYPADDEDQETQDVIRGVSFEAPAGSTTALVGSSGSGKSTLIGLVSAFHRPREGRILIDGKDLASLRLRDYRSHLGVVTQDNFLFDGTVADNIAYGNPGATRADVEQVAAIAHVDEFVDGFEDGYDTVIGERGVKVSGGQRQRIAIARAILADPSLLILDEATSSLDSESEGLIQDALGRLREGRTTFVIAHRLSTIRQADQILVIEDGRVVERGSHEQLLALAGRYRELYDKQYQVEMNRFVNPGEDWTPDPEETPEVPKPSRAV